MRKRVAIIGSVLLICLLASGLASLLAAGQRTEIYYSEFSTDPTLDGWTLDPGWQWGEATPSTCSLNGSDPAEDHSASADNLLVGFEIGGCYTNNMGALYFTSPSFDLTGKLQTTLTFWRWLGVESSTWDHASIEISVDGGTTWETVWDHSGESVYDDAWTEYAYDISQWADYQPDVQIRFVMGPTDSSVVYFGWNIDDLAITAEDPAVLEGTVTEAATGLPIEGALVEIEGTPYSDTTAQDGTYQINAVAGTFDVTASKDGYNPLTVTGVELIASQTTVLDFELTAPEIDVDPTSFSVELDYGDSTTDTMRISNLGDGPLEWSLLFVPDQGLPEGAVRVEVAQARQGASLAPVQGSYDGPHFELAPGGPGAPLRKGLSREMWDLVMDLDIDALTGDQSMLGAEFAAGSIWVSGAASDPSSPPNYLYEVSPDGTELLNTYEQAASCASDWGYRDLAFDGQYLYAGCSNHFYQIDPADGTVVADVTHSLGVVIRALAYIPETGTFVTGDFANDCYEFSFDGTSITPIRSFSFGLEGKYGMAYDDVSPGGPYLWIFDQSGSPATTIYQADISVPGSEYLTGVSHVLPLLPGEADQLAGGLFLTTDWVPDLVVLGGLVQGTSAGGSSLDKVFGLELGTYSTWLGTDPSEGTVPPLPEQNYVDVTLTFDSSQVAEPGVYTGTLEIISNDGDENPFPVDITMTVLDGGTLEGTVTDSSGQPIIGAEVTIVELGDSQTTNESGFY